MTEHDRKLLLFLAVFLIVVGSIAFVFRPGVAQMSRLKEEVKAAEAEKEDMEVKAVMLPAQQKEYKDSIARYEESINTFYPIMQNQEIDRLFTDMISQCNLSVQQLNITAAKPLTEIKTYAQEESTAVSETETEADTDTGSTDPAAIAAAAEEDEPSQAGSDEAKEQDNTEVMFEVAEIVLAVSGPQENIDQLFDQLTEQRAIRITGYSTDSQLSEDGAITVATQISLALYMCEKEG